jgi:hypothetical protein
VPEEGGAIAATKDLGWSVVSGQWSVVSGQWSVVSGQWSVVRKRRLDIVLDVKLQFSFSSQNGLISGPGFNGFN